MRLFAQDESRLGLREGTPRRRLTSRGVKPHQEILPRYEYVWLFAAVEDGAPAHVAHRPGVPRNVLLVQLPAYSPELNPVERLGEDVRQKLGPTLHHNLDTLKHHAATILCAYTAETLASLTGYPYLLRITHAL